MLKTTLAGLRAHKLRLVLTAVAITLGVGFIAGTFVLTDTVDKAFAQTFAKSAEKIDVAVLPGEGEGPEGEDGIPQDVLEKVRAVPGVTKAAGLVRGDAALVGEDGKAIGDMPTVALSMPPKELLRYDIDEGRAPRGGGEVVIYTDLAEREGFEVGETATVLDGKNRPHRFTVVGLVDFGIDQEASYRGAVGFDTATALRMTGEKTYRELDVLGGDRAAIAAAAGGSHEVLTGEELGARLAQEAGADTEIIRSGLLLFGMVAMLVSALVIYNTFSILIAQRMREMALLRCVGATRRQVFGSVVTESVVVGFVGSLLGLAAGLGLGWGLLALVHQFNEAIPVAAPTLAVRTIVIGLAVGVVVTVASALLPARAATRVSPVTALRADLEPGSGRFRLGVVRTLFACLFCALGLAAGGYASLVMEKGPSAMYVVAGGGALFFVGVIAAMPALVRPLGRLAGAVPARIGGVPGRLAVANARRSPRRTATTTIALTVGVGLMSLFAVIASSGKATSTAQIDEQFPVEFQLNTQFGGDDQRVPHALAEALRQRPEFANVIELRDAETKVGGEAAYVSTVTGSALGTVLKPKITEGSLSELRPGTALMDEYIAERSGLSVGDTTDIATGHGTAQVKIVGVHATPAFTGLLLSETDFDRNFTVRDSTALMVDMKDGADANAARKAIEDAAQPYPTVRVMSVAEFKDTLNDSVNTMLMIFGGLLGLAIVIALFGIANTLTLSVVERTRESALLRALGITKRQLRRMLSIEALVMAVIGAFTGVVLGIAFGWAATEAMASSAVFALPYGQVAAFIALAAVAGVLAAVMPARRAAKASIVESLSTE
ncbi:ABC transporter permease [Actinomadura algeriensis]|uniref:ABC transport system permease protein n=1 Tax=Actinomadura algeriensis TaxID=1679523 RepID=A0ABR9JQV7_9ACTN|nr:ABC transporter permease [Actinomadura algeriensis]MBE1532941.1 putative ABC transport system permease protein [Actinomadura algeriensis]